SLAVLTELIQDGCALNLHHRKLTYGFIVLRIQALDKTGKVAAGSNSGIDLRGPGPAVKTKRSCGTAAGLPNARTRRPRPSRKRVKPLSQRCRCRCPTWVSLICFFPER